MGILKTILRPARQLRARLYRKSRALANLIQVATLSVCAFAVILFFTYYVMQPYQVDGSSMEPTLHSGDRLFILRSGKILADFLGNDYVPKRGEIVIFQSKVNNKKWIKRVIGLPEERIVIKHNRITIYNEEFPGGFELDPQLEPALPDFPPNEPVIDRIVKKGEIFVVGDNRAPRQSSDSRGQLGNIALEDIDGVVLIRVVPFSNFRVF